MQMHVRRIEETSVLTKMNGLYKDKYCKWTERMVLPVCNESEQTRPQRLETIKNNNQTWVPRY